MIQKINEMLKMQQALDGAIEKEHGLEYGKGRYTLEGLKLALLDELGEVNHENKGNWCWWKKTQAPVNREKLLEELVDSLHFALCIAYHNEMTDKVEPFNLKDYRNIKERNINFIRLVAQALDDEYYTLEYMIVIIESFGFTIDDAYEMYCRKNAINYLRLQNGY